MVVEDEPRYVAWRQAMDRYREAEERLVLSRMGKPSALVYEMTKNARDKCFDELVKAIEGLDHQSFSIPFIAAPTSSTTK